MSIPRDHHYLPQFYLERWAKNGELTRYIRPRGPDGPIDCKRKTPRAIAYERDLYQLPDIEDPIESQGLELGLFQQIDDRAAAALRKLDQLADGTAGDRVALSQFMISLMHRSPSRLAAIRAELARRSAGAPYEGLPQPQLDMVLKGTANRLIAELIQSERGVGLMSGFKVFKIETTRASKSLLTSDRPVMASAQLIAPDAFLILPYSVDRMAILCHDPEIARSFGTQDPNVLVNAINLAVVEQSEDVIIASDTAETEMIDRIFLRPQPGLVFDSIGLIRRKSPFIDLRPKTRSFSRHNKRAMLYLGRN